MSERVDWIEEYLNLDENLNEARQEIEYETWRAKVKDEAKNVIRLVDNSKDEGFGAISVFRLVRYIRLLEEEAA